MGDLAGGRAPLDGDGEHEAVPQHDLARIADAVREVVAAQAALISRVVDDEWLEIVAGSGTIHGPDPTGTRWRRADLERYLDEADQRGNVHVTTRRAVSDVDVPDEAAFAAGGSSILLVPQYGSGELVGVLATIGYVDLEQLDASTYERVELYGDQARLAIELQNARRALAEHHHRAAELQDVAQYRRDLVASLTHDLKTPLTAISLNAQLLEDDASAETDVRPVAAIRRSAERLSTLVDDLLALARAEEGVRPTGGGHDVPGSADAVELVREAVRYADVEAQRRGVRFVFDLPQSLVAGVDGGALTRVYVNVVDNAVKYSRPGGEVRISLRAVDGLVEMTCADDGIGIAEEDQAAVFDMFRQARDSQARGVPGTGVGLAISRRIVTRLGGTIELASRLGHGTTFVVRVPAR